MEIGQSDLNWILDRGEDSVILTEETTKKLIQAILDSQKFCDLVFDLYEGIEK